MLGSEDRDFTREGSGLCGEKVIFFGGCDEVLVKIRASSNFEAVLFAWWPSTIS